MKLTISVKNLESGAVLECKLNGPYCMVGRKNSNVLVDDTRCSQQHLMLYEGEDGALWVRDLGSTNGTFVNKVRITEKAITETDTVRLGRTEISVVEYSPAKEGEEVLSGIVGFDRSRSEDPEDKTQKTSRHEIAAMSKPKVTREKDLVNQWPENIQASPKKEHRKFTSYVDEKKDAEQQAQPKIRKRG